MSPAWRHPLRVASRLLRFVAFNTRGLLEHRRDIARRGLADDPRVCAAWLQKYAQGSLTRAGIQVECTGTPPTRGMVVSNHVSYLDIPLLCSVARMVFVSKAEVANWPFLGACARCGGTLFLKREQRSHVAEVAAAFRPIIDGGTVVVIFPEGTSSGGDTVLPFRSSLLEPAAANDWPVTPACVSYEVVPGEGTVADDVAYWRDMTFAPHFFGVLGHSRIKGRVAFGEPLSGIPDRKELTRRLHAAVSDLLARQLARTA